MKDGSTPRMSAAELARFEAKYTRGPGCWLWTGALRNGYGQFWLRRRMPRAHRLSYRYHVGPIPDGLCVLHNCPGGDNPACVNPAHLWLGTQADNMRDMAAKGRSSRAPTMFGEEHVDAKLTTNDVRAIRRGLAAGTYQRELAATYGVSESSVSRIKTGRSWAHVE